jgi:hypothetical protein
MAIFPGEPPVGELCWFSRDDAEWSAIAERLKQTPCPHCSRVGPLIRHGFLYGFDDSKPTGKTLRARRIFCSNRNARPGCGRTFSVWLADKIRRLSLTSTTLWQFLQRAATDGILNAVRAVGGQRSDRTWQRVWTRFNLCQTKIRTALFGRCSPPDLPAQPPQRPAAQVLAHLQAAFPGSHCPITAFQHSLRVFFV